MVVSDCELQLTPESTELTSSPKTANLVSDVESDWIKEARSASFLITSKLVQRTESSSNRSHLDHGGDVGKQIGLLRLGQCRILESKQRLERLQRR
jgi:hypothetical protein